MPILLCSDDPKQVTNPASIQEVGKKTLLKGDNAKNYGHFYNVLLWAPKGLCVVIIKATSEIGEMKIMH